MLNNYCASSSRHRFIRSEEDDSENSWEQRLAKRYYDKLFKEYPLYMLMLILLACKLIVQANICWKHVSGHLKLSIYCTFKWLIYWCTWHQIRYCIADMTHYKDGKVIIFSFTDIIRFFFLLDIELINSSKCINGLYLMVVTFET